MKDSELAALYNSGLTIREIAERVGLSYEKIRQKLKTLVKWHRNYISDLTRDQIGKIVERFDNGETVKSIAKFYELSPPAISRLLVSEGKTIIPIGRKYDVLREVPFNSIHKQIIVGTILGKGRIYKDSKKSNFKLSFMHCEEQERYFHWKVAMMDPFINTWRKNTSKDGKSTMLQTATITHKEFNMFAHMFYTESRVKVIPKNLDMYLTPLALAVWVMDDGGLNSGVNLRLATMSFTEAENYILRDYLKQCFNLRSKVMGFKMKGKQYYQITLNKENTQKLSDIIRKHVVPSMQYKIMPEPSTTTRLTPFGDDIV